MNGEDLRFLAERAETVMGRPDQRLAEVHARIKSARRRRAAAVAAGASASVLAVAIGIAVLTGPTGTNKDNGPIPPADSPTKADAPAPASTRRIVYAEGWPIRTIHVGDELVDISDLLPGGPNTPVYLNTTDGGVVFTVDDDESRIWFTDGTSTWCPSVRSAPIPTLGTRRSGPGARARWQPGSTGHAAPRSSWSTTPASAPRSRASPARTARFARDRR